MGLTVLLGGARSGKSSLAVRMADSWTGGVTVIATGEARDEEMAERIAAHRRARPDEWATIEEPRDLEHTLVSVDRGDLVIVDCLTLWAANLLEQGTDDAHVLARAAGAAEAAAGRSAPVVAITNEVGSGIVPMHPLARRYRDLLGGINSAWVARAEAAYLLVAGGLVPITDPTVVLSQERSDA
jgi:adenosyl cobinamide kinase/adenosyl cobinamide phosphate guanylyltransferase